MIFRGILDWSIDRGWINPPNAAMTSKNTKSFAKVVSNPFLEWDKMDIFIKSFIPLSLEK